MLIKGECTLDAYALEGHSNGNEKRKEDLINHQKQQLSIRVGIKIGEAIPVELQSFKAPHSHFLSTNLFVVRHDKWEIFKHSLLNQISGCGIHTKKEVLNLLSSLEK